MASAVNISEAQHPSIYNHYLTLYGKIHKNHNNVL